MRIDIGINDIERINTDKQKIIQISVTSPIIDISHQSISVQAGKWSVWVSWTTGLIESKKSIPKEFVPSVIEFNKIDIGSKPGINQRDFPCFSVIQLTCTW